MAKKIFSIVALILFLVISCKKDDVNDEAFHFYVATDAHVIMKDSTYTNWGFRDDVLENVKNDTAGLGDFIVVTGDLDPFYKVKQSVEDKLGSDFRFYPVLGNHDVGMTNNMYKENPDDNWGNTFDIVKYNKNKLKNMVNTGPEYRTPSLDSIIYVDSITKKAYISTYDSLDVIGSKYTTYSFDKGNSHFVILDLYSGMPFFRARHKGRIINQLYSWLNEDLKKTNKENIFVFAHQPIWNASGEGKEVLVNEAYKAFCKDSARSFGTDSIAWFEKEYSSKIKSRQDFWNLLKNFKVTAYFCGHTHHYSVKKIEGIWEINLEFSGWKIESRTRYGEVFINKNEVDLFVKGYIEKTHNFKVIEHVILKS